MDSKTHLSIAHSPQRVLVLRMAALLGSGILLVTASGCSSNKTTVADTPSAVKATLTPKPVQADWLAHYNATSQAQTEAMRQSFWRTGSPNASAQNTSAPSTTTKP